MDSSLRRCDGDVQKADYLQDTGVFEYYWRILGMNRYSEWLREQNKKK